MHASHALCMQLRLHATCVGLYILCVYVCADSAARERVCQLCASANRCDECDECVCVQAIAQAQEEPRGESRACDHLYPVLTVPASVAPRARVAVARCADAPPTLAPMLAPPLRFFLAALLAALPRWLSRLVAPLLRPCLPQPALCLARHGAREDYAHKARGENWQQSAARPWDPPLTAGGVEQGARLGTGLAAHLHRLGRRPVDRIISSPLLRCVQTAAAAAAELGMGEISVEPALTEGMLEHWYRSWAVPGADSTWGGPAHARMGTPSPPRGELHPASHQPAFELLMSAEEAEEALRAGGGEGGYLGVRVSRTYRALAGFPLDRRWGAFESEEELSERMHQVLTALARRYPSETLLLCSHGGPCGHAYYRMVGEERARRDLQAGYTALYVFVRRGAHGWDAPIAADQSHLQRRLQDAPDVAATDLGGPNDAAEQQR